MEFRRRKRILSRLEITPLIDVVLLLLIFFMISTTFVTTPGIKVKLPRSTTSQAETKEQDLVVVITEEGQLYFDNKRVSLGRLRFGLEEKLSGNKDRLLIVKADKESKHGRVVEVMDLAKKLGISRIAIATEPTKKK